MRVKLVPRFLSRWFGSSQPKRKVRAAYEAANDGVLNRAHFANADFLGPNAANSPDVAAAMRSKARYERENDGCLNGLGKQLGVDLIGTGPRLQINADDTQLADARKVENHWRQWFRATVMLEKLRLLVEPRPFDGEVFGIFTTNPANRHAVKLDMKVIEADQVTTPTFGFTNVFDGNIDGIEYDEFGNPSYYHVLKEHPGDGVFSYTLKEFDRIPAAQVVHWFRPDRPAQARGVSEFASVINSGAQTRRYGQATLTAAELMANITGAIETNLPPSDGDDDDEECGIKPGEKIRPTMGTVLTLTNGSRLNVVKPEQPTSTHKEFVDLKRADLGRPVGTSKNQVTGNSDGASYSSGRLDRLDPQSRCWVERERLRLLVLDKLFLAWLEEARLIGLVPDSLDVLATGWNWNFDGFPSIDPFKDANAQEKRINIGVSNLAIECGLEGYDWREVLTQRAAEIKLMRELGIPVPNETPPPAMAPQPVDPNAVDENGDPINPLDAALEDTDLEPKRRRTGVLYV